MKNNENLNVNLNRISKTIPLAFDESMSYYETICQLVYFLEHTIIPNVDYAVTKVDETIALYLELKNYVDNYFDNLDIQTEINNKLDDMLESGQLEEIIGLYIQSNAVLGFKTVSDMKNATNFVDGSIARTISNTSIGDDGGRYYLIRTLTSSDVIDEVNIIALENFDTLIAELIGDDRFTSILNTIGNLENLNTSNKTSIVNAINSLKSDTDTSLITKETKLTELVIFGDSWSDPTSLNAIWGELAGDELNLNVDNYAKSGSYMSGTNADSLQGQISTFNSSSVDKTKVKYIVILGGVNDYRNNVTYNNFVNKVEEQIEILKGYCPQAKIIFVSNCEYPYTLAQGKYWCGVHEDIRAVNKIVTYNMFGTIGKEVFNSSNYFHLTQTGQKLMLSNIIASLTGGELIYWEDNVIVQTSNADFTFSSQRIGNFVLCNFTIDTKAVFGSTTFNAPSGVNFNYSDAYNGVGGWSDSNYKQIAYDNGGSSIVFAFNGNSIADKHYHYAWIVPLMHN